MFRLLICDCLVILSISTLNADMKSVKKVQYMPFFHSARPLEGWVESLSQSGCLCVYLSSNPDKSVLASLIG